MTKEERKEYFQNWVKKHPGYFEQWNDKHPEYAQKRIAYYKKWRKHNPKYQWQYTLKSDAEHLRKIVRAKTNRAVLSGKLKRENCFCGLSAQAHHDDYNKPLDVKWLCKLHHEEYHKNLIAQK